PVLLGHEVPDALPAAVGEVARQAGDVGEVVVEDGVAEVHVALGVPAERAVLREPLVEPQRDLEAEVVLEDGLDGAAVEDVVDDGVDELVVDDAAEVPPLAGERDGDPVLEQLRHAADALGEVGERGGVVDGEVVVALVDEDGDAVRDVVVEEVGDVAVGRLGGAGGEVGEDAAARGAAVALVEVDVEVLGLDVAPVEGLVLDAVLPEAEVLRVRARHEPREARGQRPEGDGGGEGEGGAAARHLRVNAGTPTLVPPRPRPQGRSGWATAARAARGRGRQKAYEARAPTGANPTTLSKSVATKPMTSKANRSPKNRTPGRTRRPESPPPSPSEIAASDSTNSFTPLLSWASAPTPTTTPSATSTSSAPMLPSAPPRPNETARVSSPRVTTP